MAPVGLPGSVNVPPHGGDHCGSPNSASSSQDAGSSSLKCATAARRQREQQAAAKQNSKRSHMTLPSVTCLNPLEAVQKRCIDTRREMGRELVASPHD